jgi:3-phosphoshikimate 1-carboxyvinyltransferase
VSGNGQLSGVEADLREIGETAPTFTALAALAALSGQRSELRGIGHLRGHETDRLAALEAEVGALGGKIAQTDDGLVIEPADLRGGRFRTYEDHRMATTAAIIGLRVPEVHIENIETTAKTMPDFPMRWGSMVANR